MQALNILVASTQKPVDDWKSYFVPPVPPKSYKGEDAINSWLNAKWADYYDIACNTPALVASCDYKFVQSDNIDAPTLSKEDILYSLTNGKSPINFFGFDVFRKMQILFMSELAEVFMRSQSLLGLNNSTVVTVINSREVFFIDPSKFIAGGTEDDRMEVARVIKTPVDQLKTPFRTQDQLVLLKKILTAYNIAK